MSGVGQARASVQINQLDWAQCCTWTHWENAHCISASWIRPDGLICLYEDTGRLVRREVEAAAQCQHRGFKSCVFNPGVVSDRLKTCSDLFVELLCRVYHNGITNRRYYYTSCLCPESRNTDTFFSTRCKQQMVEIQNNADGVTWAVRSHIQVHIKCHFNFPFLTSSGIYYVVICDKSKRGKTNIQDFFVTQGCVQLERIYS